MKPKCPHCESEFTKKNGHTHYGKQNHRCKICGRQFVINGQDWFIPETTKKLIDKLLLERISLAGIARVTSVSEPWLLSYLKTKYKELPDDLNADLNIPEPEIYLEERFDEEINRLKKKDQKQLRNIQE